MQSQITLIRAISAEFVRRKLTTLIIVGGIVFGLLLGLALWLTTVSAWWWLLAAAVIMLGLLGIVAAVAAFSVIKLLRPALTAAQNTDVRSFVDKLERVADNLQTPVFIIVFRVMRDAIWPRDVSFIQSVTKDSTTLHADYLQLQKLFTSRGYAAAI